MPPRAATATVGAFAGLKSTDPAIREEILPRTHAIWESEGHPFDRKLANWLEAEAAVMAGCQTPKAEPRHLAEPETPPFAHESRQ